MKFVSARVEQCSPFLLVCAGPSCVQTWIWLPMFGIFNVRTDVDACDYTQGRYKHHQKKLTLGKKLLAAPGTPTSISTAPGFSGCYSTNWGVGIAQWLERRTHDWKVAGLNPCGSGRRIFFSRVNLLCWLLLGYPFHPCVTAVACKRPQPFCQMCRRQVTAKHACTLCMWLCMKWHGAWLYGVHRTHRDGSSFMWHQPCQCCKYSASVDIQKCSIKSYLLMENHMGAQWVCSRA